MESIFASKALVGSFYTDAKHGHVLRVEKQAIGKTIMSVYVPFYGWQTFSVPETYLLKEISKNQLEKIKEAVMSKKVIVSKKGKVQEKGESINSVIDELMLKGSTIGAITKKIIAKFPNLAEKVKEKGPSYAASYVYTRVWDLRKAGRKVKKDGVGSEATLHLVGESK